MNGRPRPPVGGQQHSEASHHEGDHVRDDGVRPGLRCLCDRSVMPEAAFRGPLSGSRELPIPIAGHCSYYIGRAGPNGGHEAGIVRGAPERASGITDRSQRQRRPGELRRLGHDHPRDATLRCAAVRRTGGRAVPFMTPPGLRVRCLQPRHRGPSLGTDRDGAGRFADGGEDVYLSLTVNSTSKTGALLFPVPDKKATVKAGPTDLFSDLAELTKRRRRPTTRVPATGPRGRSPVGHRREPPADRPARRRDPEFR